MQWILFWPELYSEQHIGCFWQHSVISLMVCTWESLWCISCSLQVESIDLALQLLDQSTHRGHTLTVQTVRSYRHTCLSANVLYTKECPPAECPCVHPPPGAHNKLSSLHGSIHKLVVARDSWCYHWLPVGSRMCTALRYHVAKSV